MAENNTSRVFLISAVVMGVLATVLAFAFIQSSAGVDRGPKVRIVVASEEIRPNAVINPEKDLKVEEVPVRFSSLAQQSLDPDARNSYKGQRVNRRIYAGQPIFLADLAAGGALELRGANRALTIPADPGLVIPGDYVQVLVAQPESGVNPETGKPNPGSATMINNGKMYRVLAVGSSLSKTRSQATIADQYQGNSGGKTVTLEVTPVEAVQMVGVLSTNASRNMLLICPAPVVETPATVP